MKLWISFLSFLFGASMNTQVFPDTSDFVIIDVRTKEEFAQSHIKKALLIDFLNPNFKTEIQKLDKNKIYKLYCRSGNRSGQAEQLMKSLGFKDVENLGSLEQAAKRLNQICEGSPC